MLCTDGFHTAFPTGVCDFIQTLVPSQKRDESGNLIRLDSRRMGRRLGGTLCWLRHPNGCHRKHASCIPSRSWSYWSPFCFTKRSWGLWCWPRLWGRMGIASYTICQNLCSLKLAGWFYSLTKLCRPLCWSTNVGSHCLEIGAAQFECSWRAAELLAGVDRMRNSIWSSEAKIQSLERQIMSHATELESVLSEV